MKSGAARKKIDDFQLYKDQLTKPDPSMSIMQGIINAKIRKKPKKGYFCWGWGWKYAAKSIEFGRNKLGVPILIGSESRVKEQLKKGGLDENYKIEIVNLQIKVKRNDM